MKTLKFTFIFNQISEIVVGFAIGTTNLVVITGALKITCC
jgi:hypothetical protein